MVVSLAGLRPRWYGFQMDGQEALWRQLDMFLHREADALSSSLSQDRDFSNAGRG
jgi:hypothetical protein